jgi:predicted porin
MNKTLIVAAVSALAAGSALAQSSVTIYGRFNTTAESVDAGGVKTKQLVNNSSRIGFKGTEDLGGGLKAGFQLEHGFNADTGTTGSSFWGRQSEVNLGGAFGTVRMGNFTSEAYFATADYISMHNHDTGNSSDMLYAYVGRNTNKIAYRLPELAKGMSLEGAVSAGEGGGRVRSYDLAWNYALGALQLGAGYEKNDTAKQFAIRGLYEMGPLVLGAYVQKDTDGYGKGFGNRTTLRFSGAYNVGASEFHLNVGSAGKYSKVTDSKARQFTLGYNYNLSKRTKVYGYYTKTDNNKLIYGPTAKGDFSSIAAGIRHNF